jgi:hypothetical protein
MQFAVIVEKGPTSYGAHVPDLPGCVATADAEAEVLQLIPETIWKRRAVTVIQFPCPRHAWGTSPWPKRLRRRDRVGVRSRDQNQTS